MEEIRSGHDRTGEVNESALPGSALELTSEAGGLGAADVYIIAVPTPVDAENRPDLGALRSAAGTVGRAMNKGAIVVLESTVYPGITENILGPGLEAASGLDCGSDFFLGYAPERINPGDREHTLDRITKVVAGQTPEVTATLTEIYGTVTSGGVFVAKDIRTAEAAKVIENAQRDINIAFVNEVTKIFHEVDISVLDVLEAASTKWNFLGFSPGLVGGHCIGVDPFYLAHCAQEAGYEPGDHPRRPAHQRRHGSLRGGVHRPGPGGLGAKAPGDAYPGARADVQGECAGPAQFQGVRHYPAPRRAGLHGRRPRSPGRRGRSGKGPRRGNPGRPGRGVRLRLRHRGRGPWGPIGTSARRRWRRS